MINVKTMTKGMRSGLILFALIACSSANAGLVKYDVAFGGTDLGHMVFDADIGAAQQNLWGSLISWEFGWAGVEFTSANSLAAADSLFVVNEAGAVISDVEEILEFLPCGFRVCVNTVPTKYPLFTGVGATSLGFLNSPLLGEGVLLFNDGTGEVVTFGTAVTYSGPSEVPLPATILLFGPALLWLGALKRKKA